MAVAVGGPRPITPEEQAIARTLVERARAAMAAIADYDQATVDRLCRAGDKPNAIGDEAVRGRETLNEMQCSHAAEPCR